MEQARKRKLAVLVLSATFVPTAVAQDNWQSNLDNGQRRTELLEWKQSQKPDPVPSPKPVPLPDQQPEQRPAPEQPPTGPSDDTQKEHATQTFAGTILKAGKKYVLKTVEKVTYDLDDQDRAKKYEGKKVQVTGILDESSKLIHVQDMKAAG
jgi:hypothetical protein